MKNPVRFGFVLHAYKITKKSKMSLFAPQLKTQALFNQFLTGFMNRRTFCIGS